MPSPVARPALRRACSSVAPSLSRTRVLGLIAHINSGKTTTSEAMLFHSGYLTRMGSVDTGSTTLDFEHQERHRGITISAASAYLHWKRHNFFLVDSPGHLDFTFEVEASLRAMDSAVVLLDAVAAVQPQTETVWRQADANHLPRLAFVNKMDRDAAQFPRVVQTIASTFAATPAVLQHPIFDRGRFVTTYPLLHAFPSDPSAPPSLADTPSHPPPQHYQSEIQAAVDHLVETVADFDDQIMTHYLNSTPITRQQIRTAIRNACTSNHLVPVLCGSSLSRIGVDHLMDAIVQFLPSPQDRPPLQATLPSTTQQTTVSVSPQAPFIAYAFKVTYDKHRGRLVHLRAFAGSLSARALQLFNTTKQTSETPTKLLRVMADKFIDIQAVNTGEIFAAAGLRHTQTGDTIVLKHSTKSSRLLLSTVRPPPPVFSVAVSADSTSEEKLLHEELSRVVDIDASLETRIDDQTGDTLLSGMGELHLEVTIERMRRALKFPLHVSKPRVAYRESVASSASKTEVYDTVIGNHKRFAALQISVQPLESDKQYRNHIEVHGFSSEEEHAAVKQGLEAALGRGVLLGHPITNVSIRVEPGDNNPSFADPVALRACAGQALRNVLPECSPILLEPVMLVELKVPEEHAGDIVSELSHPVRRRGLIEAVERDVQERKANQMKELCSIRASVPLDGLVGWASKMRSLTKGRGDMSMEFSSYRAVDDGTVRRVIEQWCGV